MEQVHSYRVDGNWMGARIGAVSPHEIDQPVHFSSPPEFGGEAGHWTPEHMLVAAVASCYLATFSAMARNSKLEFLDLGVTVYGTLTMEPAGWRFNEIVICPRLTLADDSKRERAERLLLKAERSCLIARSLSANFSLQATVHIAEEPALVAAGGC